MLKKACKEKDDQLSKLKSEIRELKHSIASSALEELSGGIQSIGLSSPEKYVKFREPPDNNNNHVSREKSIQTVHRLLHQGMVWVRIKTN